MGRKKDVNKVKNILHHKVRRLWSLLQVGRRVGNSRTGRREYLERHLDSPGGKIQQQDGRRDPDGKGGVLGYKTRIQHFALPGMHALCNMICTSPHPTLESSSPTLESGLVLWLALTSECSRSDTMSVLSLDLRGLACFHSPRCVWAWANLLQGERPHETETTHPSPATGHVRVHPRSAEWPTTNSRSTWASSRNQKNDIGDPQLLMYRIMTTMFWDDLS